MRTKETGAAKYQAIGTAQEANGFGQTNICQSNRCECESDQWARHIQKYTRIRIC